MFYRFSWFLNLLRAKSVLLACLYDQNKCGFFWRAGFYSANQNYLKSFHKALIGWKKVGSQKKTLLF